MDAYQRGVERGAARVARLRHLVSDSGSVEIAEVAVGGFLAEQPRRWVCATGYDDSDCPVWIDQAADPGDRSDTHVGHEQCRYMRMVASE